MHVHCVMVLWRLSLRSRSRPGSRLGQGDGWIVGKVSCLVELTGRGQTAFCSSVVSQVQDQVHCSCCCCLRWSGIMHVQYVQCIQTLVLCTGCEGSSQVFHTEYEYYSVFSLSCSMTSSSFELDFFRRFFFPGKLSLKVASINRQNK